MLRLPGCLGMFVLLMCWVFGGARRLGVLSWLSDWLAVYVVYGLVVLWFC